MPITEESVRERFPALSQLPPQAIAAQIEDAYGIYCASADIPVVIQDKAALYCTAHFLTLEVMQQSILTGITTGVAKGDPPTLPDLNRDSHWQLTVYGLQFRDLLDSVPMDAASLLR